MNQKNLGHRVVAQSLIVKKIDAETLHVMVFGPDYPDTPNPELRDRIELFAIACARLAIYVKCSVPNLSTFGWQEEMCRDAASKGGIDLDNLIRKTSQEIEKDFSWILEEAPGGKMLKRSLLIVALHSMRMATILNSEIDPKLLGSPFRHIHMKLCC